MKALAGLAVLTVLFYWKLTLTRQFTYLSSPDLVNQVLPWYQMQARAWHGGELPLWDPYQWCGQSLVGQLQPGAAFPLNWPLFWAPLEAGKIRLDLMHWHFVGMHWLAAVLMYAYCRELGRSRWAAVLAGVGFSFGGYVGTTLWPQMMNAAVWMPLVFLLWRRGGRANTAGCGAALGVALLAGHHQPVMFMGLALAGVALYQRRVRELAVAGLFAALVGGLALVPAWEYGARAYRWMNLPSPLRMSQTVPYIAQQGFGAIPLSLLGVVTPVDQVTTNPLVGVAATWLALAGVALAWGERAVRLHGCLALGGLAYALGSYSVFQGLLYGAVPFLDKARSPGQALLVFQFGLLVVAAHGMDALGSAGPWRRRLLKGLVGAGVLAWVAALLLAAEAVSDRTQTVLLSAVVALLLAAAVRTGTRAGIVALMLVELAMGTDYLVTPRRDLEKWREHEGVVRFLKAQPGVFRFHAEESAVPYNLGDWEGLEDTAGYLASVSADLYDFVGLDWGRSALWLNQVYVVAKEKTRPEQEEVYSEPSGLKVFRNPDAFPRAWLAELDPGKTPAPGREGSVDVVERGILRIEARVRTTRPAMVVFSDPMFPGWRGRVDGREAPVYAAYGALRGVAVEAGEHRIEMVYRPWSVYLGAALSVLGVAGWGGLLLVERRGSRRRDGPGGL